MSESRKQSWIGAQGLELTCEMFGHSCDSPVILVHGGGQSRHAWRAGARAIAAKGYYAVTIDMRGHGDSDWAPDGDYSPDIIGSDIQALMRKFDRPVVLVGASRGGYGTLIAAARDDPRPAALVLIEIAPRVDQSGANQIRAFMRASASGFGSLDEAAELLMTYMGRPRKASSDLQRSMRQDEDGRWFWRWDPKMAVGTEKVAEEVELQLEDAARKIACPMLLVRGENSELVKTEHARHLQTLVPQAKIVTIKGAGHMISGDENAPFNAAIADFISNLEPDEFRRQSGGYLRAGHGLK